MMGWRAWYTEGRVFDSDSTRWEDLPDDGVLVVVGFLPGGTSCFCAGDDWYWLLGDAIAHNSDPIEENRERYPGCSFKRGKWAPQRELEDAISAATEAVS